MLYRKKEFNSQKQNANGKKIIGGLDYKHDSLLRAE